MFPGIINRPYDIIERQKAYQNHPLPHHKRLAHRALKIRVFGVGLAAGGLGTLYGVYVLIRGKQ